MNHSIYPKNIVNFSYVWTAITGAISILLILYFCIFHGKFSKDPSVWGQFGDYIGGVLAPILTLINIWLLISLTKSVVHRDDERSIKELRYNLLREFTKTISDLDCFNKPMRLASEEDFHKPRALIEYLEKFPVYSEIFFSNSEQLQKYQALKSEIITSLEKLDEVYNANIGKYNKWIDTEMDIGVGIDNFTIRSKIKSEDLRNSYSKSIITYPTIDEWWKSKPAIEAQFSGIVRFLQNVFLHPEIKEFS